MSEEHNILLSYVAPVYPSVGGYNQMVTNLIDTLGTNGANEVERLALNRVVSNWNNVSPKTSLNIFLYTENKLSDDLWTSLSNNIQSKLPVRYTYTRNSSTIPRLSITVSWTLP